MQSLLLLHGRFQNFLLREQKSESGFQQQLQQLRGNPGFRRNSPPPSPQEAVEHVTELEMLRQQRRSELQEVRRGEAIHAERLLIRDAQPSWRGQAGVESKKLPSFDGPELRSQRPHCAQVCLRSALRSRRERLMQLSYLCPTKALVH